MRNEREKLVKELAKECTSVEDVQEKLRDLFKDTLQEIFEAELDDHLGYQKHSNEGDNTGNSRNGYRKKTIKIWRIRNYDPPGSQRGLRTKDRQEIRNHLQPAGRADYRHVCQGYVLSGYRRPHHRYLRSRNITHYSQ